MGEPFSRWICDVCGLDIEGREQGYVLWSRDDARGYHDFKIIHRGTCDKDQQAYSAALDEFLGMDGIARLTALMSDGIVRNTLGANPRVNKISEIDHFVDFFRRVQLSHYEDARQLYMNPESAREFADAGESLPYLQRSLERVAREN